MKKFFFPIFLFLFIFTYGFSISAKDKKIFVGVIGPLTGINNFSGVEQLNGVELAFQIVNNNGGVKGFRLIALPCDDRGIPEISANCTKKLIKRGVIAILGAINSSCTLYDMEIAEKHRIPIITSSSTATIITEKGNRFIFRCIDSDFFRMSALVDYLVEECSIRRFALFYEKDAYGKGLKRDFEKNLKKYNLKITYTFPFKRGEKNFEKPIKFCKKQGIEAVGLFGITEDNIYIAEEIYKMGYKFKLFSPDVNEKYLSISPEAVDGLIATDSFYLRKNKLVFKNFFKKYLKKFGSPPGPIAGRAFDAANILIDALKRAKNFKGESIRDAILSTNNFSGVTGDFNFKPNGDVVKKFSIIMIKNGKFVRPTFTKREKNKGITKILIILFLILMTLNIFILKTFTKKEGKKVKEKNLKKIKKNPYIVGNPVRDPAMFFGREEDFKFIKNNLSKSSGSVIILFGERRSGKSSILYQILNGRLGDKFMPILIDLQLFAEVKGNKEFSEKLNLKLMENIKGDEILNFKGEIEDVISRLTSKFGEKHVLLMFDEYEIMENLVEKGHITPSILTLFSGFLEKYNNLNYIFAGTKKFIEKKTWQQIFNKSVSRKVSFLRKKDAISLIKKPVSQYFTYEENIPERIYRLTNGHPFYTQAICMYIVDHIMESRKEKVSIFDLIKVVDEIVDNPLPEMLYFWHNLKYEEKLILSLLSEILEKESEVVNSSVILNYIDEKKYPIDLDIKILNYTLETLFLKDTLNKFPDGYNFKMDFFRIWIKREHSIWEVVGEKSTN